MPNIKKRRLIVADRNEIVRIGVRRSLEDSDFGVVGEAASGDEAIQLAQSLSPDIVLMNVELESMDGIEAARELRHMTPATKVIMLTGGLESAVASFESGAHGYSMMDVRPADLLAGMESVCQDNLWIEPRVAAILMTYVLKGSKVPSVPLELLEQAKKVRKRFDIRYDGIGSDWSVSRKYKGREAWTEPTIAEIIVTCILIGSNTDGINHSDIETKWAYRLSKREREVLTYLAQGLTNKDIAEKFMRSQDTVKKLASRIYKKLGVSSRAQAAQKGLKLGII